MSDSDKARPLQARVARLRDVAESARSADPPTLHSLLDVIAAELEALSVQLERTYDESYIDSADGGDPATCSP